MRANFRPLAAIVHLLVPRAVAATAMLVVSVGQVERARADSVNSPNITLNVDTNRAIGSGNGAAGVSLTVNTITIAETTLPEYSSAAASRFELKARPGFQFDPTSNVTIQSATIGFNGGAINAVASLTPTGGAEEVLTFNLTSGTNVTVQDIARINGVKVRILNATGAAGPALTTLSLTTSTAGGAFTNQGIVAANIQRGAADRLLLAVEPSDIQAGEILLPSLKIVDFGGNVIQNDDRVVTLEILNNPRGAPLLGTAQLATNAGVAAWSNTEALRINLTGEGYTLRATHDGTNFLTSDTVVTGAFDITAGLPGQLDITTQPVITPAGGDILISVAVQDEFGNPAANPPIEVTLDSAVNPGGWPLLVDSSLRKTTVGGFAIWSAADHLRINKAVAGYRLSASGVGSPILTDVFDIVPSDPVSLRFVQQPTDSIAEQSIDPAASVEVVDLFGNRTTSTASIEARLANAACGGRITGSAVTAVAGLATFDSLTLDTPCAEVLVSAESFGLIGTTSDTFAILEGPPVATRQLFFVQPIDTAPGETLLTDVLVLDQFDRPFTAAAVTVNLSLAANPAGAVLLADTTLSKQTVNGVASWGAADRLRIDTTGTGFQFGATGVGAAIVSDVFDIAPPPPPAPDVTADPAACGACGAGAGFAFLPLALAGALRRQPMKRTAR